MIKDAFTLLHTAKRKGINIAAQNGSLQLKFTKGTSVDPQLLQQIKDNKELLINFLTSDEWQALKGGKFENELKPVDRQSVAKIPLSFSQERLWFIHQMEGSLQYHMPAVLRLQGALNISALRSAFKEIVNRHEVLRTVIQEEEGEACQVIREANIDVLSVTDGSSLKSETELQEYISAQIQLPFNLSDDLAIRANLVYLNQEEFVMVLVMHHIASDGWSQSIFIQELVSLYTSFDKGSSPNLPLLPIQYADYSIWQRNYLKDEVLKKKVAYWVEKLKGIATLQMPYDYPRPAIQTGRGAVATFRVDKGISDQLLDLSSRQGATVYMTLVSVFKILLYRYSGQNDIVVGSPTAGRQQQELEGLIGFFINTLVLRTEVNGDSTFIQLLQQLKSSTLEAYEHQDVPFEKLVEVLVSDRDLSRNPLFQVMFVLQNTPEIPELKLGELTLTPQSLETTTSKFDLTLTLVETPGGLYGSLQYNTDLYTPYTIEQMISHYVNLLTSVVNNPEQKIGLLTMLSEAESTSLLNLNGQTAVYPKDKSLIALFEDQVLKTPDSVAVVMENERLTYRELNEKCNLLATKLLAAGLQSEQLIPVIIERGTSMIVSILGILKAGGVYVPIDPEYPLERIKFILEDTAATIIVSSSVSKAILSSVDGMTIFEADHKGSVNSDDAYGVNPEIKISPQQLAYVIYTSGSTGLPKGVLIEHHSVVNLICAQTAFFNIDSKERILQFSNYSFDASVEQIFLALLNGASLVLCPAELQYDTAEFEKYLRTQKVTHLHATPFFLENIASDNFPDLKRVIAGGDVCRKELSTKWKDKVEFYNEYGPTETTVTAVEYHDKGVHEELVTTPIGKSVSNVSLYILDQHGALCPKGVPGELYIGGVQVARGYLNRPELTSERFISNPLAGKEGERVYRTGDRARWLADGNIEYLGRIDTQVKVRGYRIELGEIESVIHECPLVKQAVISVKEDSQRNKQLVAYIIPREGYDQQVLKSYLGRKLPAYMMPAFWVTLDSFPLTSNGKIDKKVLPDPSSTEQEGRTYVAPRNDTEEKLASIWGTLLGHDQLGVNENFFELGGHSLLAMRLIAAIRKQLGFELAIRDLFQYPTIAALSAHLRSKHSGLTLPAIEFEERPDKIPLSFAQERLWFIDQLEGSSQYHIFAVLNIKGRLDQKALTRTFQTIVNRHEVLRTVIREVEGHAHQFVLKENQWRWDAINESVAKSDPKSLNQIISGLITTPFNIAEHHMLRAGLIKVEEDEYVLVAIMHHIASDGWSTSILVKEVAEVYSATVEQREAKLSDLPIQYADYAIWQRKNFQGDEWESRISYWKKKLEATPPVQLMTDFVRPSVKTTNGAIANLSIEEDLSRQLKDLSNAQGGTLFITLLAAFKVLLFKYTGQEDICIGTPISGRTQHEFENLIGNFVNTLALRSFIDGNDTFLDHLHKVWNTTLEAYEYQDVPFEKVVEEVVKERIASLSPLFQIMFVLHNTPEAPRHDLTDIQLTVHNFQETKALFDLTVNISETSKGLQVAIAYNTDLYKADTIELMLQHYGTLLRSIVANPESTLGMLDILDNAETLKLTKFGNQSEISAKEWDSIVGVFQQQATKTPAQVALVFEDSEITYQELDEQSNRLAHYLISLGVEAEQLVPICLERSTDLIISILAVMKAGAAYVPVDINYPMERIRYMMDDTKATLVLVGKLNSSRLSSITSIKIVEVDGIDELVIKSQPASKPEISITSNQLAYVIYTSGSTGKPKGVLVQHNNVVSLVKDISYVVLKGDECLLVTGSTSFDASTFEYWSMLLNGGRLILCKESDLLDISNLQRLIKIHKVSIMWFTSSWFNQLIEADVNVFEGLKTILTGGEKLSEPHINKFIQAYPQIELINGYGPTENTTFSLTHTIKSVTPGSSIPIGSPLSNRSVFLLDKYQRLVTIGVPGEICVSGAGLSRGYLNRPDLTEEKYIFKSFGENKPARLYRTGDLGRWLPDGSIEYLGRIDNQLKIRGYRIEPGEIENEIYASGMVRQAVVLGRSDQKGVMRLVAYLVAGDLYTKEAVRAYVLDRLPEFMIPSFWIEVDAIPLTINGKTDVNALPLPEITDNTTEGGFNAPATELEVALAKIWEEVLEVDNVGLNDNFFQLGGHSLLAIRLASSINKELDFKIVIKDVFDYPTIALLARQLEDRKNESARISQLKSLIQIKGGSRRIPLYIVSGGGGTVFKFKGFADMLDKEQPVYGIQQPTTVDDLEDFPKTIEGIAAKYNEEILQQNPEGPYALSGHCLGGTIAFEMTKQLEQMGKKVVLLALFDTQAIQRNKREPGSFKNLFHLPLIIRRVISMALLKLNFELFLLRKHTKQAILYKVKKLKLIMRTNEQDAEEEDLSIFNRLANALQEASVNYEMKPYTGDLLVFYAKEHYYFMDRVNKVVYKEINYSPAVKNAWNKYAKSVTFYEVDGEHSTIFDPLYAAEFSKILQEHLNQAG